MDKLDSIYVNVIVHEYKMAFIAPAWTEEEKQERKSRERKELLIDVGFSILQTIGYIFMIASAIILAKVFI